MIPIPLSVAITIYVLGFLAFLLLVWTRSDDRAISERWRTPPGEDVITCNICGNVYADKPSEGLSLCPLCQSYNEVGDDAKGKGSFL